MYGAPLGSTNYPVPAGAVFVAPNGDDVYGNGSAGAPFATVNKAAKALPGTGTIVLRGGTYHQQVALYSGDYTISAYPGEVVWFDGSVPVTGWRQSGSTWIKDGWTAKFDNSASYTKGSNAGGFVNPAYPLAANPDMVFVDGRQLDQVTANPGPGQFSVNYSTNQIVIGSDPNGHEVRASDLQQAFILGAKTRLLGFGVRRYATSLWMMGTVFMGGASDNTLVQNLVVTDNAGVGITMNRPGTVYDHVTANNNGLMGILATYADNSSITNSVMSGNNRERFNAAPSSAGTKISRLNGITISGNNIYGNYNANGVWTDENVTRFTIVDNYIADNGTEGAVAVELSDTGVIAGNSVINSKWGITVYDTGNVQVMNNTITGIGVWGIGLTQDNRWLPGHSTAGPNVQPSPACSWVVRNVVVANNVYPDNTGFAQFYVLDKETNRPASSMNITITGNAFNARGASGSWPVVWGQGDNRSTINLASPDNFPSVGITTPNTWFTGPGTLAHDTSVAMPLPAGVAAAVGQPAGRQHFGIF